MKFLKTIALALPALLITSCGEEPKPDLHSEMRQAAQQYYTLLLQGKYDAFASGIYSHDSLPPAYRSQLADAAAQFAVKETKRRGGLTSFEVVGDSLFTDSISGYAVLRLTFGDKSSEQTILSLIRDKEVWKMQ